MTTEDTESTEEGLNRELTEVIIGAAITVHRELGPGLLESVYEKGLAFELADRGLSVATQKKSTSATKISPSIAASEPTSSSKIKSSSS